MRRWLYTLATVIAIIPVIVGVTTATAMSADAAQAGFATRAYAAGLTNAQVQGLEQKVSGFIGRYGGTQVAINEVAFHGGSMLFAVPGHNARDVANASAGTTVETADSSTCPLGAFCEWDQYSYSGDRDEFFSCIRFPEPFGGLTGSWKNDQTPQDGTGPQVKMYIGSMVVYTTPPPWSGNQKWGWRDLTSIKPC